MATRRRRRGGGLSGPSLEHTWLANSIIHELDRTIRNGLLVSDGGCRKAIRLYGAAEAHVAMADLQHRGRLRRELVDIDSKLSKRCSCVRPMNVVPGSPMSGLGCPGDARVVLQGLRGQKRRRW